MNQSQTKGGKLSALIGCTLMLSIVYMSLTSWSVAVNELASAFSLTTPMMHARSSIQIDGYDIGGII